MSIAKILFVIILDNFPVKVSHGITGRIQCHTDYVKVSIFPDFVDYFSDFSSIS